MAFLSFNNVRVAGISAAVPKTVVENIENTVFPAGDVQSFITNTGIERYRVADKEVCTSDMTYAAATKLMAELNWDPGEVELLLFISQYPDYIFPNTATILQDRLQLPKSCVAFDMSLGCSAYVYGLSVVAAMMSSGAIKKALFLCGDTPNKNNNAKDPSTAMLFGDAGTATALEYDVTAGEMKFSLRTDGAGYKSIMIPAGAGRHFINSEESAMSAVEEVVCDDGITRNKMHQILDGMNVFSFGISKAPASVKETAEHFAVDIEQIDQFVFHQANMMMNEIIRKKLKLPKDKVPYSLKNYGNTSSASIPITIVTGLKEKLTQKDNTVLLCGFGVGLSWGSCIIETTKDIVIPDLIEI